MGYRVVKAFRDSDDNLYHYRVCDPYPREGYEPSEERIAELAGNQNRLGMRLIVKVADQPNVQSDTQQGEPDSKFPKHIGGGVYELSNGEKVKGKDAAIAAQAELDASD